MRQLMKLRKNFDSLKILRVSYIPTTFHAYDAFTAPG